MVHFAKRIAVIVSGLMALTAVSCADRNNESGGEPVTIERLDSVALELAADTSAQAVAHMAHEFAPALEALRVATGISPEVSADSLLKNYAMSQAVRVFAPDIRRRLAALPTVECELGALRRNLVEADSVILFPKRIYGIATPYNQSVTLVDSVMLIGLNHYLGADYQGYAGFDDYRRRLKRPDRIVYDVAEAVVASAYPFAGRADATVLSRMLYEGALMYALLKSVPGATEASVLGYDDAQMRWAEDNEARIWDAMVKRDMLYSTDPALASKLLDTSAATLVIHPEAPGRIGRFIGLKIVESFIAHEPSVGIGEMLMPAFYETASALKKAAYQP